MGCVEVCGQRGKIFPSFQQHIFKWVLSAEKEKIEKVSWFLPGGSLSFLGQLSKTDNSGSRTSPRTTSPKGAASLGSYSRICANNGFILVAGRELWVASCRLVVAIR
jgi:hypothetical protein